ncbi:MAG: hypothetical protein AAF752_11960, partial [Bacteroidota bacterium]
MMSRRSNFLLILKTLILFVSLFAGLPCPAQNTASGTGQLETETFSFEADGNRLVGLLDTPVSQPAVSTIILV